MSSRIFRDGLLEGKVALVTGGGTGIGAAISRELAFMGATVVIASRTREKIDVAAAGLTEQVGRQVFADTVDIRDRDAVTAVAERTIAEHGRIDILVNNGGGQFFSPAEAISPRGFDAVLATNLTGTWNMTRAVFDQWMGDNGGSILNITMLTNRGFPGMAHSVSARAGVEAMTRTLAVEWAARGVRINCIQPGIVASAGMLTYPNAEQLISTLRALIPMKRLATSEEVAWLAAFLASPAGAYVTGQIWTLDGGKELWGDLWGIADPDGQGPVEIHKEPWE